jgi:CTP:molybdopterin cytidylyltransferase MocA
MDRKESIGAVVTAGQSLEDKDPLLLHTQGRSKALISIAGKPMIAHVVDALAGSTAIDHIVVVALDSTVPVRFSTPVDHVPGTGGLVTNVAAGLRHAFTTYPSLDAVLVSSCDVPTITPAIVDAFVAACLGTDCAATAFYSVVERSAMERRFPGARRSYMHLSDGDFCGGDLLLFRRTCNLDQQGSLQKLARARKSVLRQASLLGPRILLKLVLRRLSFTEIERRFERTMGVRGRAIASPHAELAMDVDRPHQLELVRGQMEALVGWAAKE